MPHPTDDQRVPLSGPAFGPDERIRPRQVEHFHHWQDLVDKRLIGTIPQKTPEQLAAIDAWERGARRRQISRAVEWRKSGLSALTLA